MAEFTLKKYNTETSKWEPMKLKTNLSEEDRELLESIQEQIDRIIYALAGIGVDV
jgi:hypothetical protein